MHSGNTLVGGCLRIQAHECENCVLFTIYKLGQEEGLPKTGSATEANPESMCSENALSSNKSVKQGRG